eukprot:CAMPEP_0171060426 /NCGR_PEP_ID=MMETSP0766_2-20121228/3831_1 /TAXON_ID=439317 /ORGANISM="Gambierdiscus australes, Strain CAWD 149" /LENGTH=61 /DNA_ID=CAMNT_0011516005 /DNA_START=185 /DNA_END=367 /DNA_ORIENTATION=-
MGNQSQHKTACTARGGKLNEGVLGASSAFAHHPTRRGAPAEQDSACSGATQTGRVRYMRTE